MTYNEILLGLLAIRDDKPMPPGLSKKGVAHAAHRLTVRHLSMFRVRDAEDATQAFAPVRMTFEEFMRLGSGELAGCRCDDDSLEEGPDRPVLVWLPVAPEFKAE